MCNNCGVASDRFSELRAFVTVVDSGSLTAAADRLEVAKSAVSRRLRALEDRLGVELLRRTTRRLTLTDAGRTLYERAVTLLDDLAEIEAEVSSEHCALAGTVRMAAPVTFGVRQLAPVVGDFLAHHPGVEIDLDLNDRRVDLEREGYDLALRIGALEDSTLLARKVAQVEHVVCASPDYLEREGRPATPDDLSRHPALVYSHRAEPDVWQFEREGRRGSVRVPVRVRAGSGSFVRELAARGHGVALEPDFIVHDAIERGELEPLLTAWSWPALSVSLVFPKLPFRARRVEELLDFLTRRLAEQPWSLSSRP